MKNKTKVNISIGIMLLATLPLVPLLGYLFATQGIRGFVLPMSVYVIILGIATAQLVYVTSKYGEVKKPSEEEEV